MWGLPRTDGRFRGSRGLLPSWASLASPLHSAILPLPVLRVPCAMERSLVPGSLLRPADLFFPRWDGRHDLAVDLSIRHPCPPTLHPINPTAACALLTAGKAHKRSLYHDVCSSSGTTFAPVFLTTWGSLEAEACPFFRDFVKRLYGDEPDLERASLRLQFMQSLGIRLMRFVGGHLEECLAGCLDPDLPSCPIPRFPPVAAPDLGGDVEMDGPATPQRPLVPSREADAVLNSSHAGALRQLYCARSATARGRVFRRPLLALTPLWFRRSLLLLLAWNPSVHPPLSQLPRAPRGNRRRWPTTDCSPEVPSSPPTQPPPRPSRCCMACFRFPNPILLLRGPPTPGCQLRCVSVTIPPHLTRTPCVTPSPSSPRSTPSPPSRPTRAHHPPRCVSSTAGARRNPHREGRGNRWKEKERHKGNRRKGEGTAKPTPT